MFTAFLVLTFALSSATTVFAQPNWGVTTVTAPEGGNWTDPDIWVKNAQGEDWFPEDTYPGEISEGSQAQPVWVEIRHGMEGPVIVDQEIEFGGRLDAPEGGTSFPNMAGSAHLLITETGSLTLTFDGDTYRFGLGGGLSSLLEIDGGAMIGPIGIVWLGSWSGTAEVNITNGGLIDANWTQVGIQNGTNTMNIHDGTFATNRLTTGTSGGTGIFNLLGGEMQVRGPIQGQPSTFTLGVGANIIITDGLLRAHTSSLAAGLTGANIDNWVNLGNITGEHASVAREMTYTGWNGLIRWNDEGDEVLVWAIHESGNFEGPSNRFVLEGDTAEFSVSVEFPPDSGTVSYQWQHDGVDLPGETEPTLILENAAVADMGLYTLVLTEESDLGTSTASASANLVVVGEDRPVLLNADMQVSGPVMSGHGMLREDGVVEFIYEGDQPGNQMEIGEGDTIWNSLGASGGSSTYSNFVDAEGFPLAGVTASVSGAAGGFDAPEGGGIDAPIGDWSGPLLRDMVYTTGDGVLTASVGGLQAFAGREFILVVYALGPESTFDEEQSRDDVATVRLASVNNHLGLDPVETDAAEGRDLRWNERAWAAFEGRVAANGTINWTVGPVPDVPGWNAMNGFQILLTSAGEAPDTTPIQEWRMANFGTAENAGMAANSADFDGDGIKNLIEYAIGADPAVPGDSAGRLVTEPTSVPLTFVEDFDFTHDFLAEGLEGTGWSRITGAASATNPRIEAQDGVLFMTSSGTNGEDNPLAIGRRVPSGVSLQATARIVSAPSNAPESDRPWVEWAAAMLYIGRSDGGGISDYIAAHHFDLAAGNGNGMQRVLNFTRTNDGPWAPSWAEPWMRIQFNHETGQVTAFRSADGTEWEEYGTHTLTPLIAADAELEIGFIHALWTNNSANDAWVEWADFEIVELTDGSGRDEIAFLSMEFDYIGDPSLLYNVEVSNDLDEEWNLIQTIGPFFEPGRATFIDSVPFGGDDKRFLRLNVVVD